MVSQSQCTNSVCKGANISWDREFGGDQRGGTGSTQVFVALCWIGTARVPLGLLPAGPSKLNSVFHICHIKLCPPEPSVLSGAVKDTFQPLWDTPSLPQAVSAQGCCHFTPQLRFRMKQPSPPLPFLVAIPLPCGAHFSTPFHYPSFKSLIVFK